MIVMYSDRCESMYYDHSPLRFYDHRIIVHACTKIIVRACMMIIARACAMIIVQVCTMIIVHVLCPSGFSFRKPSNLGCTFVWVPSPPRCRHISALTRFSRVLPRGLHCPTVFVSSFWHAFSTWLCRDCASGACVFCRSVGAVVFPCPRCAPSGPSGPQWRPRRLACVLQSLHHAFPKAYDPDNFLCYDHSTCMQYDHSACMYYDHSTCMY